MSTILKAMQDDVAAELAALATASEATVVIEAKEDLAASISAAVIQGTGRCIVVRYPRMAGKEEGRASPPLIRVGIDIHLIQPATATGPSGVADMSEQVAVLLHQVNAVPASHPDAGTKGAGARLGVWDLTALEYDVEFEGSGLRAWLVSFETRIVLRR